LPTPATAGSSTVPELACTRSTKFAAPPNRLSSCRVARADPEFGSVNPAAFSLPNAVNPSPAPTRKTSNDTSSTARERRTTSDPIRPNMPALSVTPASTNGCRREVRSVIKSSTRRQC